MNTPLTRYRISLSLFIFGLIVSGITAFPLRWEIGLLNTWFGASNRWIAFVHSGIVDTYDRYPFFGYGTDWLAFGHLIIAAFFVFPLVNPVRYRALLHVGLLACAGVVAIALICGPIRQIPFSWTLIDCSFGILGAIPLLYCLRISRAL